MEETDAFTDIEITDDAVSEPDAGAKLAILANTAGDISGAFDDSDLAVIGQAVVDEYEQDRTDRKEWEDVVKEALEHAAQERTGEVKSYPWANASNIRYPILTTAALQFNARAYPAIVKGDEAISVKVVGKDQGRPRLGPDGQPMGQMGPDGQPVPVWESEPGAKTKRAGRVKDYMNTTIFYRMEDWEEDTDALLLQLPIVGCVFRKVCYDSRTGLHRSHMVPAMRVFVPKGARSCKTTPRLTEEMPDVYPIDIIERQRDGTYRDFDLLGMASGEKSVVDAADRPRMLLEQYRLIDMDGDGLPEPYIVTVDHESRNVLRIEPNFSADGIVTDSSGRVLRIERGQFYVKFDFFPHPEGNFYGIGLGHLLKNIGAVIDTAINQMMDAGHAQVAGGGFIASGVRLAGGRRSGNLRFSPGEWKTVDVSGSQLRDAMVERTFPGPSPIMMNILDMMLGAAKDISSVKDVITGEASNNGQVGTTLALIEQGLQVFTAIYKRTYRALKEEYSLLFENMSRYATDEIRADYKEVLDDPAADFDADFNLSDMDIRPVSDPSSVTNIQRMGRAQFLMQFVGAPGVNPQAIMKRAWEAANIDDADELLMPPAPPQPDPKAEASAMKDQSAAVLNQERAQSEAVRREGQQLDNLAKAFGAGQVAGFA